MAEHRYKHGQSKNKKRYKSPRNAKHRIVTTPKGDEIRYPTPNVARRAVKALGGTIAPATKKISCRPNASPISALSQGKGKKR